MKTFFKYYHLSLLLLILSCTDANQSSKPTVDHEKDEAAIRATIESETSAYVKRDSVLLFSHYLSDPVTQTTWNTDNGGYGMKKGIEEIRKSIREEFKNNPTWPYQPDIKRTNWLFKPLSEDWVYVNFLQIFKVNDTTEYNSYETRLIKRVKDDWKIAVIHSLNNHGITQ